MTSDDALELVALQSGAVDFIAKPLVAAQLISRVRAQLRVRLLAQELERDNQLADDPTPTPSRRSRAGTDAIIRLLPGKTGP